MGNILWIKILTLNFTDFKSMQSEQNLLHSAAALFELTWNDGIVRLCDMNSGCSLVFFQEVFRIYVSAGTPHREEYCTEGFLQSYSKDRLTIESSVELKKNRYGYGRK